MYLSYHPDYQVELPPGHPFPMGKYRALHGMLVAEGILGESNTLVPVEASLQDLRLVHCARYLERLERGGLSAEDVRRLGMPWSAMLWRRSRLAAQGTVLAARAALEEGLAGNLAGGTHHAFADRGEGFCVLNDVAVAIRVLQQEGRIQRAAVIDLDVHQGNGTAAIFAGDADVFTFSVHGERNYPTQKMRSTLDVGLPDGTGDEGYLAALAGQLPTVLQGAELAFLLAGVDPAEGDRYGRLALTESGLRMRDRLVIEASLSARIPLVIVLAGGYASTPERTAHLHANTFREAASAR
jgi:acetoin utilization deacetylase AcuC-like enzyme